MKVKTCRGQQHLAVFFCTKNLELGTEGRSFWENLQLIGTFVVEVWMFPCYSEQRMSAIAFCLQLFQVILVIALKKEKNEHKNLKGNKPFSTCRWHGS